ncbi:MAG: ABC transporter substrate-binding protein [Desulfotalea sp.]
MRKIIVTLMFLLFITESAMAAPQRISVNLFVEHPSLNAVLDGFQDYLKEKNVDIEYSVHIAQANMGTANQIAKQMLGEEADLYLAITTPSAQTCAQAITRAPEEVKKPLLFSAVTNPVAAGLIKDPKKPTKGITGVSDLLPIKAHLEMLLAYMPKAKKIGVLYNPGEANSKATIADMRKYQEELGFEIIEGTATKTADVYQAAKSLVGRVDLIFIATDNTIISALESVLKVGIQNQIPVFSADTDSVERGTVAAMGFNYYKHGAQAGAMAERILSGTKVEDIPVEYQHDLELYLNLDAAQKMGVTPPQSLVDSATKILK